MRKTHGEHAWMADAWTPMFLIAQSGRELMAVLTYSFQGVGGSGISVATLMLQKLHYHPVERVSSE